MKRHPSAQEIHPVVGQIETQRLGESAWAPRDQSGRRVGRETPKSTHLAEPFERFCRAKQDGGSPSRLGADDIHARMDPVAPIRVETTGGPEHRAVAGRRAPMSMGRGVASVPEVGLDLDDPDHEPHPGSQSAYQTTANQVACDMSAIPRVEPEAKWRAEGHPSSIGELTRDARPTSRDRKRVQPVGRCPSNAPLCEDLPRALETGAGMADAGYAVREFAVGLAEVSRGRSETR